MEPSTYRRKKSLGYCSKMHNVRLPHGIELVVSEVKLCSFESKDIVYCYVRSQGLDPYY